jgi:cytochrome d ubiquinol oxidase subunit I
VFPIVNSLIVLGPLVGISAGWIFTEMGRQPWIVFGQQKTADAVSPLVTSTEVWISMIGFTAVYAILAVIEVALLLKFIKQGAPEQVTADPYAEAKSEEDKPLYFAY